MNRETNEQVFDQLIESEGTALRRLARSYEADPARREDLFQEIVLAVWTALPRFRGESSLRTFVFRIAHNQGLRHASRAAKKKTRDLSEIADLADRGDGPQENAERRQQSRRLQAAVLQLPLVLRQAIVLQLEGLTTREISEVLGASENGVLIRLSRARSLLRKILQEGNPS